MHTHNTIHGNRCMQGAYVKSLWCLPVEVASVWSPKNQPPIHSLTFAGILFKP